ncbi:MAG: hypothetical protein C0478_13800 [Planctomyces sp.]|jgi:uncharacterized membrane protein YsdA (DUF1294 family)|nr:hypothetical protein [Planctomyces sp.]
MDRSSFSHRLRHRFDLFLVGLAFLWLAIACFWLYRAVTIQGHKIGFFVAIYLFLTIVCSGIALVLAFVDKRRAVRERPRISERTLHGFSLAGGWPGTCLGNWLFRHKTQKMSYQAIFWLIAVIHISAVAYCLYLTWWPNQTSPVGSAV